MKTDEVKRTEQTACELISKNGQVFDKNAPLALAKSIQGLRAVFDETYPDPVRVLSIGEWYSLWERRWGETPAGRTGLRLE